MESQQFAVRINLYLQVFQTTQTQHNNRSNHFTQEILIREGGEKLHFSINPIQTVIFVSFNVNMSISNRNHVLVGRPKDAVKQQYFVLLSTITLLHTQEDLSQVEFRLSKLPILAGDPQGVLRWHLPSHRLMEISGDSLSCISLETTAGQGLYKHSWRLPSCPL